MRNPEVPVIARVASGFITCIDLTTFINSTAFRSSVKRSHSALIAMDRFRKPISCFRRLEIWRSFKNQL